MFFASLLLNAGLVQAAAPKLEWHGLTGPVEKGKAVRFENEKCQSIIFGLPDDVITDQSKLAHLQAVDPCMMAKFDASAWKDRVDLFSKATVEPLAEGARVDCMLDEKIVGTYWTAGDAPNDVKIENPEKGATEAIAENGKVYPSDPVKRRALNACFWLLRSRNLITDPEGELRIGSQNAAYPQIGSVDGNLEIRDNFKPVDQASSATIWGVFKYFMGVTDGGGIPAASQQVEAQPGEELIISKKDKCTMNLYGYPKTHISHRPEEIRNAVINSGINGCITELPKFLGEERFERIIIEIKNQQQEISCIQVVDNARYTTARYSLTESGPKPYLGYAKPGSIFFFGAPGELKLLPAERQANLFCQALTRIRSAIELAKAAIPVPPIGSMLAPETSLTWRLVEAGGSQSNPNDIKVTYVTGQMVHLRKGDDPNQYVSVYRAAPQSSSGAVPGGVSGAEEPTDIAIKVEETFRDLFEKPPEGDNNANDGSSNDCEEFPNMKITDYDSADGLLRIQIKNRSGEVAAEQTIARELLVNGNNEDNKAATSTDIISVIYNPEVNKKINLENLMFMKSRLCKFAESLTPNAVGGRSGYPLHWKFLSSVSVTNSDEKGQVPDFAISTVARNTPAEVAEEDPLLSYKAYKTETAVVQVSGKGCRVTYRQVPPLTLPDLAGNEFRDFLVAVGVVPCFNPAFAPTWLEDVPKLAAIKKAGDSYPLKCYADVQKKELLGEYSSDQIWDLGVSPFVPGSRVPSSTDEILIFDNGGTVPAKGSWKHRVHQMCKFMMNQRRRVVQSISKVNEGPQGKPAVVGVIPIVHYGQNEEAALRKIEVHYPLDSFYEISTQGTWLRIFGVVVEGSDDLMQVADKVRQVGLCSMDPESPATEALFENPNEPDRVVLHTRNKDGTQFHVATIVGDDNKVLAEFLTSDTPSFIENRGGTPATHYAVPENPLHVTSNLEKDFNRDAVKKLFRSIKWNRKLLIEALKKPEDGRSLQSGPCGTKLKIALQTIKETRTGEAEPQTEQPVEISRELTRYSDKPGARIVVSTDNCSAEFFGLAEFSLDPSANDILNVMDRTGFNPCIKPMTVDTTQPGQILIQVTRPSLKSNDHEISCISPPTPSEELRYFSVAISGDFPAELGYNVDELKDLQWTTTSERIGSRVAEYLAVYPTPNTLPNIVKMIMGICAAAEHVIAEYMKELPTAVLSGNLKPELPEYVKRDSSVATKVTARFMYAHSVGDILHQMVKYESLRKAETELIVSDGTCSMGIPVDASIDPLIFARALGFFGKPVCVDKKGPVPSNLNAANNNQMELVGIGTAKYRLNIVAESQIKGWFEGMNIDGITERHLVQLPNNVIDKFPRVRGYVENRPASRTQAMLRFAAVQKLVDLIGVGAPYFEVPNTVPRTYIKKARIYTRSKSNGGASRNIVAIDVNARQAELVRQAVRISDGECSVYINGLDESIRKQHLKKLRSSNFCPCVTINNNLPDPLPDFSGKSVYVNDKYVDIIVDQKVSIRFEYVEADLLWVNDETDAEGVGNKLRLEMLPVILNFGKESEKPKFLSVIKVLKLVHSLEESREVVKRIVSGSQGNALGKCEASFDSVKVPQFGLNSFTELLSDNSVNAPEESIVLSCSSDPICETRYYGLPSAASTSLGDLRLLLLKDGVKAKLLGTESSEKSPNLAFRIVVSELKSRDMRRNVECLTSKDGTYEVIGKYASTELKWPATLVGRIFSGADLSEPRTSEMENYCLELLKNHIRIQKALEYAVQVASGDKPRFFPKDPLEADLKVLVLPVSRSASFHPRQAISATVGHNTGRVVDMNQLIVSRSRGGYSCEAKIKSENYQHAFAYLNSEDHIKTFLKMFKDIFGASTICEHTETDVTLSDIYPGFSLEVRINNGPDNDSQTERVVESATGVEYTIVMGQLDQKRLVESLARVLFVLHTMSLVKPKDATSAPVSGKGVTYDFNAPQLVVSSTTKKCVETYFNVPHADPKFLAKNNLAVPCALMGSVKSGPGAFGELKKQSTALCTNDRVALTCTVRSEAGKIAFVHRYRDSEYQADCPSNPQDECDAVLQNMMVIDPNPFKV